MLYGVQITLAGEKAGIFAGLDFEILYRKLSDSLGVYHIALKLPDVMRHLEFGEVSITLPNVVVDIYTDGSFYLDLGFPYNNDWTVSFGLQVFPFVGAGGFYFGKLSTAAAAGTDLVPHITNGTFGPVIEFGVALQVGVGKTISEGPLRAGLSLTVQGIVTGVVSWFNPTDASLGSAQYYRIQGSVAVVGQLYGSVDFKIISHRHLDRRHRERDADRRVLPADPRRPLARRPGARVDQDHLLHDPLLVRAAPRRVVHDRLGAGDAVDARRAGRGRRAEGVAGRPPPRRDQPPRARGGAGAAGRGGAGARAAEVEPGRRARRPGARSPSS